MKKLLIILGICLFVSCQKPKPQEPPIPPTEDVSTTFIVDGMQNRDIKLISSNDEEFESALDNTGTATIETPADVVFTKLIAGNDEILIGRKADGEVRFKVVNGNVVLRAPINGEIPIGIVQELMLLNENITGNYLQETDLDLIGIDWTPICQPTRTIYGYDYSVYFKGNYDGGGHKIHNLTIENTEGYYLGLFGAIGEMNDENTHGSVSNLTIASGSISGKDYCAGIVVRMVKGTISNCANYATVRTSTQYVGGIVAQLLSFSTIENSANYGEVSSTQNEAGGVVYSSVASIISNCENHGVVTALNGVGGIIGTANGTNIVDCTNYGEVEAKISSAGGICATIGGSNSVIEDCVNVGVVRVNTYNGGGIVASQSDGEIRDCENKGIIEYTGEPQNHTAGIGGIVGSTQQGGEINNCINSAEAEIRNGYSRIGGIVGYVNDATVTGCINYDDISVSYGVVGGIAGENRGNINSCENEGKITGQSRVGGIVGDNYTGTNVGRVRMSINKGEIKGDAFVGGICGINYGVCSASINEGRIVGTIECTGGIAGGHAGNASYILASINRGSVEGVNNVGGLTGAMNSNGLMEASYSIGSVNGSNNVGGICGSFEDTASMVNNCYWSNYSGKGMSMGHGTAYYFADGTTPAPGVTTGWPVSSATGWGIGNGTDSNWWKSLGTEGTTNYPVLFWE